MCEYNDDVSNTVIMRHIGVIHTPHTNLAGMPIQPAGARDVEGRVELLAEYAKGLDDVAGFSHLFLLYHFHRSEGHQLRVTPFMDEQPRGLFATRAPKRPNPIGLSLVRVVRVEGSVVHVLDVDMLDGTPLLDLKPYAPRFDEPFGPVRTGWLAKVSQHVGERRSDGRFK
ncbi:MAG: tRNA (N6-threonylcarbamoyladenosine(37)-N6)-methyltransferase TrmO [Sedimentisphaerales bacterium]|nr:tRNA (N6-threonylcarbamoyladenosine(37)-N6)-methyltransferase TrmO [Sedimentisphaerales bacterium]